MKVEKNKVVTLNYQVNDDNTGVLLESSFHSAPLSFIFGVNHIVNGMEKGIEGMVMGQTKEFTVPSSQAYGSYDDNSIKEFPMEQFEGIELKKGMTLMSIDDNNQKVYVKVADFDSETVKIDYNHPLSGKDLKFTVEIIDVREAYEEELESGMIYQESSSCGCGSSCGCH
ncbi:MAG: peptidylprolyl isomerase [Saprospiraceae bacterium]